MSDVMGETSGPISSSDAGNSGAGSNNNNASNNSKASAIAAAIGANGSERISAAVTKVLQGYDWTLVPVATK